MHVEGTEFDDAQNTFDGKSLKFFFHSIKQIIYSIRMFKRMPSLKALRAFEAAARYGSFKRAATELALTPGAISYQVRQLESHFETALFIRKTRQTDKTIGISMGYDREAVTHWLAQGLQWISLGGDFNLLYAKVKDTLDDVRSLKR